MDDNQLKKNEVGLLALVLSFFLPPLGVALEEGFGTQFIINCLLTLFGWFPGVVHALWIIFRNNQ